jgi:hypothetical protein
MMSRVWIFMLVVACPFAALAQSSSPEGQASSSGSQPYEPAVPPPSMVGAYGGGGGWGNRGSSTAAGSAMRGMANVISAKGDYNLATSAAAMNLTQAQSKEIQNRQQATSTYFQMRSENRAARKAESAPQLTMQQIVKIAHDSDPATLSSSQMNPVTGKLIWPDALLGDEFRPQRAQVEQLISKRASHGVLSHTDKTSLRETLEAMYGKLKAEIRAATPELTTPEYIDGRKFLNGILYAVSKDVLQ